MDRMRKRQRANTNGDAVPGLPSHTPQIIPHYDITECIDALDAADDGALTRQILINTATDDPGLATQICYYYSKLIEVEKRKVISFDHLSKEIWYKINKQYRSMSSSAQYNMSFEVFHDIGDIIQSIAEEAGVEHASFGTKASGLETLRKIGKTICMSSNDTLGHEVQNQFSMDPRFADTMKVIAGVLNDEECEMMCNLNDGRSTFLQKMEELRDLAEDYCCFDGLQEVIDILTGEAIGEDEDNDEEEEEEEEEASDLEGDDEEEDVKEEEEDEHEDTEYDVDVYTRAQEATGRLQLANGDAEVLVLECFDSDGAPKRDARSQAILHTFP